jgi:TatD family-associated radical SAM protein
MNPGESLWLDHDPSYDEIIDALKPLDFSKYKEVVFCGYGEPTCRFDILLEVARFLKGHQNRPLRINTNGLGDLVNGKSIAPLMEGLIDSISISLNAPDAESYNVLCQPKYEGAYEALLKFADECKKYIPKGNVTLSVVAHRLDNEQIDKCRKISDLKDIPLRLR